ncbi:MAG: DUF192 domain-containing protein [Planctomycetes bacterium]|nr:DUF192 domain-containing protein [Planctomycetota bacterium]
MILGNASRGALLAREVVEVRGFFSRLRGLLGRGAPPDGTALLFATPSFHSFGARAPVDVAFLDARLRVVALVRSHRPRRPALPPPGATSVLVAREGSFSAGRLEVGDLLEWVPLTSDRVAGGAGIPPEFAHLVKELPPVPPEILRGQGGDTE